MDVEIIVVRRWTNDTGHQLFCPYCGQLVQSTYTHTCEHPRIIDVFTVLNENRDAIWVKAK